MGPERKLQGGVEYTGCTRVGPQVTAGGGQIVEPPERTAGDRRSEPARIHPEIRKKVAAHRRRRALARGPPSGGNSLFGQRCRNVRNSSRIGNISQKSGDFRP